MKQIEIKIANIILFDMKSKEVTCYSTKVPEDCAEADFYKCIEEQYFK